MSDEAEDQIMDFDGSDEEFRQMLSRAQQDEDFARSVRRRSTHKRPQNVKELSTGMTPRDSALMVRGKSCE